MTGGRASVCSACLLITLLPTALVRPALAGEPVIKESRGLYGIYDPASGNFTVEPKYEEISAVGGEPGLFKAVLRGRTGIINASGDILVEPKYHELSKVGKHYLAQVDFESNSYGAAYRRGNVIVNPRYHKIEYKHGLLDAEGNVVIPVEHDILQPLAYPLLFLAGARTHYEAVTSTLSHARFRFGVVDINNTVIVPIDYDDVKVSRAGKNGKKYIVTYSRKGSPQQSTEYQAPDTPAATGTSRGGGRRIVKFAAAGRFGFKTTGGDTVVEPVFEDAWDFKNGFARVKKDGKWGFVAESGKVVVEPRYDYVWDFDGGKARVRLDDGTTAHIDPEGRRVDGR